MRSRDFLGAIGAAGVHYDDFVGNFLERSQRARQVFFFVKRTVGRVQILQIGVALAHFEHAVMPGNFRVVYRNVRVVSPHNDTRLRQFVDRALRRPSDYFKHSTLRSGQPHSSIGRRQIQVRARGAAAREGWQWRNHHSLVRTNLDLHDRRSSAFRAMKLHLGMRGDLRVLQHVLRAAMGTIGLHGSNLALSSGTRYLGCGTGMPQPLLQDADPGRFILLDASYRAVVLRLQLLNQGGEGTLSDHISRKELKQDKIHDAIEHGAEAFYLHKQITLAILMVVLIGAVVWCSWSVYHDRHTAAATLALHAAMKAYNGRIGGAPDPADPTDFPSSAQVPRATHAFNKF